MDKRIFLVDDDPYWTAILMQILANKGHHDIVCFSNGTDCIKSLHLNPAFVFLDYQMDDMDGLEVLQRIKAHSPDTGVVFCTAHENLSVAVDAMEYGSYDYLLKSNVTLEEVNTILTVMADSYELATHN